MFVLLVLGRQSDCHPFPRQLAAAQGADADQNLAQSLLRLLSQECSTEIAVLPRGPLLHQELQVIDQLRRHRVQVLHTARGLLVVGHRAGAGPVGTQVLSPQKKLNGVVSGADVFFAPLLVERHEGFPGNRRVGVVDDTGSGVIQYVVDVALVHWPGVDKALRTVSVVDRTAVETERLRLPVWNARPLPGTLGGFERRCAWPLGQRLQGALKGDGLLVGICVAGVHDVGIVRHHLFHRDGLRGVCRKDPAQEQQRKSEGDKVVPHVRVLLRVGLLRFTFQ